MSSSVSLSRLRLILALAACALVASCKAELYSKLTEVEANNMMAILIGNGIATEKSSGKEGFTINVDERDTLAAIALLNEHGFPRQARESIGKVFQKSGLMSSPFEERVRYIYALGEEVAQTLSELDGVVTARVHIVLPDEPDLGKPVKPSSAAVFIKHQPAVDLDFFVPQIRRLVSSAIEGLDYSAVTIVLAEAQPMKQAASDAASLVEVLPGLAVESSSSGRFWQFAAGAAAVAALLLVTNAVSAIAYIRSRGGKSKAAAPAVTVMEPS